MFDLSAVPAGEALCSISAPRGKIGRKTGKSGLSNSAKHKNRLMKFLAFHFDSLFQFATEKVSEKVLQDSLSLTEEK